mmetsp:Transcript_31755/g.72918  ORF Transcript_31755/g.72918 Transcript_31755/m.72918 type:complete len:127 (-) Transcript_31755:693-1073(-)
MAKPPPPLQQWTPGVLLRAALEDGADLEQLHRAGCGEGEVEAAAVQAGLVEEGPHEFGLDVEVAQFLSRIDPGLDPDRGGGLVAAVVLGVAGQDVLAVEGFWAGNKRQGDAGDEGGRSDRKEARSP